MKVTLLNGRSYECNNNLSLFEGAKEAGLCLEHSCLAARCKSCLAKVIEGETIQIENDMVLTDVDRSKGYILTCNTRPISDVKLNIEDLGDISLYEKKIGPTKIQVIEAYSPEVIKIIVRLPPTANFKYNSGQYVNLTKGAIKRSYSIANAYKERASLEFFIKKYENGLMSKYWFEEAKENDLVRMEGPIGSFFLRETDKKNIVFLATGTGIAPVKAILEQVKECQDQFANKTFWLFFGARYQQDLFWEPFQLDISNLKYIRVLSRETSSFEGLKGYVQDAVLRSDIDLADAQVYACGSNKMIESAKKILLENSLEEKQFYSDAFVQTN